ncbi:unnamed protein product [Chrysoparadoxa australica]
MYENAVAAGAKKAALSPKKIAVLGILSGCHIGVGGLLATIVGANCPGLLATNPGLQKFVLGAIGLPFGLYMTVVGGGELFTGNTAMVTAALLEKKATLKQLLKSWSISYIFNFVGALFIAWMAVQGGIIANPASVVGIATSKTSLTFSQAFVRGVLCNWLVCMAVYMSAGAASAAGKFVSIFLPISSFVAMGMDHSVANMFLIPAGMLLGGAVTVKQFLLCNLLPVTLGNIVGGAVFVAAMYSAAFGSLSK